MAAVFAPKDYVDAVISRAGGALCIAAHNGPDHFVISGERAAVASAVDRMPAEGVRARPLRLSYAAHSRCIDPVLPAFRPILETVRFEPHRIALVSNVTGALAGSEIGRPDYWLTHMRAPVQFSGAMRTLAAQGITHCIEIGSASRAVGDGRGLRSRAADLNGCLRCAGTGPRGLICSRACSAFTWPVPRSTGTVSNETIGAGVSPCQPIRSAGAGTGWTPSGRDVPLPGSVPPSLDAGQQGDQPPGKPGTARSGCFVLSGEMGLPGAPDLGTCGSDAPRVRAFRDSQPRPHAGPDPCRHRHGSTYRRLIRRWLDGLVALGILRRAGELVTSPMHRFPIRGCQRCGRRPNTSLPITGRCWPMYAIAVRFLARFSVARKAHWRRCFRVVRLVWPKSSTNGRRPCAT